MFPIMNSLSYSHVSNCLNLIIAKKTTKIKVTFTQKHLKFIKLLHSIGCINKYYIASKTKKNSKSSKSYIYISTPFYKNSSFFKSVRIVSTSSKKHSISLKALKIIQNSLGSSIMLLSTPHGLITHKKAIQLQTGGYILCMVH
jgi:ribosomal protein S8